MKANASLREIYCVHIRPGTGPEEFQAKMT